MFRKVVTTLTNYPLLRKQSKPFPDFSFWTDQDKNNLKDLHETFNILQGYGLAAPQIGILKRAIVVNLQALGVSSHENAVIMVNPILESWGPEQRNEEACFSVPHVSARVTRPSNCRVSYTTIEGENHEIELEGFPAACLQHEIDHLDGKLYLDRVGSVYKSMLLKKSKKTQKKITEAKRLAKEEFDREHNDLFQTSDSKKTTHSRKRKPKARKKRPKRSKKK
tara:strand:+ start:517 stop:1185 length:669 start_codon:yes stop_codon:yes gene_type:complete